MTAFTDYPPIRRLPHLAPAMGAVPIFGPRYGQWWRVNGLGDTAPVASSAPPSPDATTPTTITEPIAPATELAMGASTAMLSGAAVGGVAAGTWRGAGIGAGMNVGLWSALVAIGHWDELPGGSRAMLLGGAGLGLALAGVLVATRS
jgi:hypothetical protein